MDDEKGNRSNNNNNNNNNNTNGHGCNTFDKVCEETRHYYIDDVARLRAIIDDLIKDKKDLQQRNDFLTNKVSKLCFYIN